MLSQLIKIGQRNKEILELAQSLALPGTISANISNKALPFSVALLNSLTKKPFIVFSNTDEQAQNNAYEINNYVQAFYLPKTLENEDPNRQGERLAALAALSKPNSIVCTSIESLTDKQILPTDIKKPIELKINKKIALQTLAKKLVEAGYSRQYQVEGPAQFSIRGNICDIYPISSDYPVRLDFFGEQIEEIRFFNYLDQRSIEKVKEVTIAPRSAGQDYLEEPDKPIESANLTDFIKDDSIVAFQDKSLMYGTIKEQDIKLPKTTSSIDLTTITEQSRKNLVGFEDISFDAGQFEQFFSFLKDKQREGYLVILNVKEEGKRARLKEMLSKWKFFSEENRPSLALMFPMILITEHKINNSLVWPQAKLAIISDADIFIRQLAKFPSKLSSGFIRISNFEDLKEGDFLVHINHGIARYSGLATKEIDNVKRDYLILSYANNDKLFVPVTEMDRVTRYIGANDRPVAVNRLGSNAWSLTKKKVKKSVRKLAINLLELYAKRSSAQAFKFSTDTPWQNQLEDDFPFEETKGQISAIEQVKQDMQSTKPMDRLICGDVGYGKTEVALRAAFKAVQDGKQVLFLVPTTILAQQHYKTFTARLSPYPVIIEMLSRFKTKAEQQKIVEEFNNGKVDIIIGTHRLLQKDVKPKELGLIVVDEEQRFGVGHKEKLKTLKATVDVITLTATPIPRTLQMALSGIRDLSIIETPPNNRHPVITHVGPYEEQLTVNAIKKELARGGQVFYLFNEVQKIESVAFKIKNLIGDEAKVAIAHGQLKERQLEKIMLDFIEGKYNILVTTTIIESGIDVPNANTLIVDKAEMFGLAQLYQIRGRVGRSTQQAYAYLFYRRSLTETALARLKTLSDYTSLGSGYKIALRDLEIRGAGNLIGAEQSGQIAAVGFDVYTHLLHTAIDELRGTVPKEKPISRDLPLSAYIPNDYITQEAVRIDFYQKLASAKNKNDFGEVIKEMEDRFGPLPKQIKNLKTIGLLKY